MAFELLWEVINTGHCFPIVLVNPRKKLFKLTKGKDDHENDYHLQIVIPTKNISPHITEQSSHSTLTHFNTPVVALLTYM